MKNNCEKQNGILYKKYMNAIAKEIFRKSIHLCTAFVPVALKFLYWPVLIALALVIVFYIYAETSRINGKPVPIISTITSTAARSRDGDRFVKGPVTLAIGVLITALIWNYKSASIGIYALAFGDGLASLVGKIFGRITIPGTHGKTAEGSLTCFCAIYISSFLVCRNSMASLLLAFTGMIIEVFPLKDFDNLIIPICLGGLAQFLL